MNSYERCLAMLQGGPVDRLPVMPITMMFAADQIGCPYGQYTTDYRLLVEGQLAVAEKFHFDHVSVISDPSREASAFGAAIQYFDNQPPAPEESRAFLTDKSALSKLDIDKAMAGTRVLDRIDGVRLLKEKVKGERLIEGWVEGPCAEAADLRGINRLMMDFFDDPSFIRKLFELSVEMGLRFAQAQIEAGADIIGVGDAAASLVGPDLYDEFVLPYERRLVDGIHKAGGLVRLHICGNISLLLNGIGSLDCDMIDVDSMVSLSKARTAVGEWPVLAGNISPVDILMNGTPESIQSALEECYQAAGPRYIVAAGCEIPRTTPPENVAALAEFANRELN